MSDLKTDSQYELQVTNLDPIRITVYAFKSHIM